MNGGRSIIAGYADGAIPVVVTRLDIVTMPCSIPVLPNGEDGALTAPLEQRTARCGHQTRLIVGSAATCPHHVADMLSLLGENRMLNRELESWIELSA